MVRRSKNPAHYEKVNTPPVVRRDGEMYKRPTPNPFTPDWCDGYDAGLAGKSGRLGLRNPQDYWDGHKHGLLEREELDRLGSSNA